MVFWAIYLFPNNKNIKYIPAAEVYGQCQYQTGSFPSCLIFEYLANKSLLIGNKQKSY